MDTDANNPNSAPDIITIEVVKSKAGEDPAIDIFRVVLTSEEQGEWPETFGSREQLQAHLLGLQAALRMTGYPATMISWDFPRQWEQPSGKRWTMARSGEYESEERTAAGWQNRIPVSRRPLLETRKEQ